MVILDYVKSKDVSDYLKQQHYLFTDAEKATFIFNSGYPIRVILEELKVLKKYLLLLTSVVLLSGCTDSTPANTVTTAQTEETVEAKAITEIYEDITKPVTLYSPFCWDDEFISNYYGIDVSSLEEYVFSMSEDATSAETIIIMKAKDATSVSSLSDCLQVVVDEKRNEMENYLPEQFEIVEKSSVQTQNNYVWLVISENADTITKIIKDSIS